MQEQGKEALRLLFVFKLVKSKLKEKIEEEHEAGEINERDLNELCIKKSKELIERGDKDLTEKDIQKLIQDIFKHE